MNNLNNDGIINMNNGDAKSTIKNSKHISPVVTAFIIMAILGIVALVMIYFGYGESVPDLFKNAK